MEIIRSKDNPFVKLVSGLKDPKGRAETGLYLVEGVKMLADAVRFGAAIEHVAVSQESAEKSLADLKALTAGADIPHTKVVSDALFKKITDTVTPQGIAAAVRMPGRAFSRPEGNCLILDRIRDPANLGTIIRTAAATRFRDIYMIDCADAYNPKAVRGTMGGIFLVRLYNTDIAGIESLKKNGVTLIAADMSGENIFNSSLHKAGKRAIIIANEASGISDELLKLADFKAAIPMSDIESLNAGVAAGILMYKYL